MNVDYSWLFILIDKYPFRKMNAKNVDQFLITRNCNNEQIINIRGCRKGEVE